VLEGSNRIASLDERIHSYFAPCPGPRVREWFASSRHDDAPASPVAPRPPTASIYPLLLPLVLAEPSLSFFLSFFLSFVVEEADDRWESAERVE
jgi:hypothetical protein